MPKTNVYYHWGDLGDVIYSLPTVRELGPGRMVLALPQVQFDFIAPLLRAQPYITDVERDPIGILGNWDYIPPHVTHDLNLFRRIEYGAKRFSTLLEDHALPYAVQARWDPWLVVPAQSSSYLPGVPSGEGSYSRAVVARSARYHAPGVDWDREIARLHSAYDNVVFVGTRQEYRDFGRGLPYRPVSDALDMAVLMNESRYFSGNQSSPLAIAIGLGVSHTIEVEPNVPNCRFYDMDCQRVLT